MLVWTSLAEPGEIRAWKYLGVRIESWPCSWCCCKLALANWGWLVIHFNQKIIRVRMASWCIPVIYSAVTLANLDLKETLDFSTKEIGSSTWSFLQKWSKRRVFVIVILQWGVNIGYLKFKITNFKSLRKVPGYERSNLEYIISNMQNIPCTCPVLHNPPENIPFIKDGSHLHKGVTMHLRNLRSFSIIFFGFLHFKISKIKYNNKN